jgi:hypothetical protein
MPASLVLLVYFAYMTQALYKAPGVLCTRPAPGCTHLYFDWWRDTYAGTVYMVAILALVALLVRPIQLGAVVATTIFGSLMIAKSLCGVASLWCWLVVPAPLLFALCDRMYA